jgi:hypothetical protein
MTVSRERYNELCSCCYQKCRGTATTWIDGTRICKWCKRIRLEDVKQLQEGRKVPYTTSQLISLLQHPAYSMYVERLKK